MKDIILVISLLLAVGLSVVVVRIAQKEDKANKNLEEERYSRMVAEETLQKNNAKLETLAEAVREDQDKMSKIQDILDQEKNVNLNLQKQYDALSQAKSDLESRLQTVLQQKASALAALQSQIPAPVAVAAHPAVAVSAQPVAPTASAGH